MKRNRTNPAIRIYGVYLYFNSRSFRLAAKALEPIEKRSHVAIWNWVQEYTSKLDDWFKVDRHKVKEIFVDETPIKIDGQEYWLWMAYEPNLDVCLSMYLSRDRTIFVCYWFFKQLRKKYGNRKPILTDGADWYTTACKWSRLQHHYVYGTELKNIMERYIQYIKDRIECFDDHFPCRKKDCDRQHIWNWLKLFVLYLHSGIDRLQFNLSIKGVMA
jgi:putative transposase